MFKYAKRRVIVEAFQMTEERRYSNLDWPDWLHEAWNKERNEVGCLYPSEDEGKLTLVTLEGAMKVSSGDYIIKGVVGELYACKPDIFNLTYEKV